MGHGSKRKLLGGSFPVFEAFSFNQRGYTHNTCYSGCFLLAFMFLQARQKNKWVLLVGVAVLWVISCLVFVFWALAITFWGRCFSFFFFFNNHPWPC